MPELFVAPRSLHDYEPEALACQIFDDAPDLPGMKLAYRGQRLDPDDGDASIQIRMASDGLEDV